MLNTSLTCDGRVRYNLFFFFSSPSAQMALAVLTYLTTVLEPFSSTHILPNSAYLLYFSPRKEKR